MDIVLDTRTRTAQKQAEMQEQWVTGCRLFDAEERTTKNNGRVQRGRK